MAQSCGKFIEKIVRVNGEEDIKKKNEKHSEAVGVTTTTEMRRARIMQLSTREDNFSKLLGDSAESQPTSARVSSLFGKAPSPFLSSSSLSLGDSASASFIFLFVRARVEAKKKRNVKASFGTARLSFPLSNFLFFFHISLCSLRLFFFIFIISPFSLWSSRLLAPSPSADTLHRRSDVRSHIFFFLYFLNTFHHPLPGRSCVDASHRRAAGIFFPSRQPLCSSFPASSARFRRSAERLPPRPSMNSRQRVRRHPQPQNCHPLPTFFSLPFTFHRL